MASVASLMLDAVRRFTIDPNAVKLVTVLVATLFLAAIDWWLRSARGVRDPTLWWLWSAMLTWTVATTISLLFPQYTERAAYFLSPLNNAFFIGATFHLTQVRDWFGTKTNDRLFWISEAVVVLSGIVSMFLWSSDCYAAAKGLDAAASGITFFALGLGLWYSFFQYAQPMMGAIAALACAATIVRQILAAVPGTVIDQPWFVLMGLVTNMTLAMSLVALTSAWNLSKSLEFSIVGKPVQVWVVVLFVDLRGSTAWARRLENPDRVRRFMNALRKWVLGLALEHLGRDSKPALTKFLGDGYLLVWELSEVIGTHRRATDAGLALQDGYLSFKRTLVREHQMPDDFPGGIGIGLEFGIALRLTSENGLRDYLGTAINLAAKFQAKTRSNGGMVIAEKNWEQLEDAIQRQFVHPHELRIADDFIVRIRGTRPFT